VSRKIIISVLQAETEDKETQPEQTLALTLDMQPLIYAIEEYCEDF